MMLSAEKAAALSSPIIGSQIAMRSDRWPYPGTLSLGLVALGRFYETTFFDSFDLPRHDGRAVVGWQVLASPPSINGQHIPYKKLLRDLGKSRPVEGYGLPLALQFVGDPTSPWASQPFDVPPAPPAK